MQDITYRISISGSDAVLVSSFFDVVRIADRLAPVQIIVDYLDAGTWRPMTGYRS